MFWANTKKYATKVQTYRAKGDKYDVRINIQMNDRMKKNPLTFWQVFFSICFWEKKSDCRIFIFQKLCAEYLNETIFPRYSLWYYFHCSLYSSSSQNYYFKFTPSVYCWSSCSFIFHSISFLSIFPAKACITKCKQ